MISDQNFNPSPIKFEAVNARKSDEPSFKGRAGVINKKHCTINCIFSNKE